MNKLEKEIEKLYEEAIDTDDAKYRIFNKSWFIKQLLTLIAEVRGKAYQEGAKNQAILDVDLIKKAKVKAVRLYCEIIKLNSTSAYTKEDFCKEYSKRVRKYQKYIQHNKD